MISLFSSQHTCTSGTIHRWKRRSSLAFPEKTEIKWVPQRSPTNSKHGVSTFRVWSKDSKLPYSIRHDC
ncbi:unnamed protein product [Brassica oleracea]